MSQSQTNPWHQEEEKLEHTHTKVRAKHINQITMKTNKSLKFIKRNIHTNYPKLKESAYKTYVRPLVEYAASVWDPWQKNINKNEMIQHRAIRYIFNNYSFTSSVSNMLSRLNLPTLEKRRQISSSFCFTKSNITYNVVYIPFPGNIQSSMRSRYTFPRSRINIHRYSFFPELLNFGTISHQTFVIVLASDHSEQGSSKLFE